MQHGPQARLTELKYVQFCISYSCFSIEFDNVICACCITLTLCLLVSPADNFINP